VWELHKNKELVVRQCDSLKYKALKHLWFIDTKRQRDLGLKGKNIENEGLNKLRKIKEILNIRENDNTTIKICRTL
jgi:hypothetical protein